MDRIKLFEVFDMFGKPMMATDYESCIEYEYLDGMAAAGFKFKVAGKLTPRSKVATAVQDALSTGIGYRVGHFAPEVELKAQLKASQPDEEMEIIRESPRVPVTEVVSTDTERVDVNSAAVPASQPNHVEYTKQVRCLDNGKVYPNQSAAARDLHIDPAQVSDSIKTGRPRSGYTFVKVKVGEAI